MGCFWGKHIEQETATAVAAPPNTFKLIPDQYKSFDDLSGAMKRLGFENCEVVLAIDFTGSNREQGAKTFGGRDLHYPHEAAVNPSHPPSAPPHYESTIEGVASASEAKIEKKQIMNPYESVMSAMSLALETLNPAKRIMVLGFGDTLTEDHSVFCLKKRSAGETKSSIVTDLKDCSPCYGVEDVLSSYQKALPYIVKSGPTSFAPILEAVMTKVKMTQKYTFVFIIGDGMVTDKKVNANAVIKASNYPISISMIGTGDGPWTTMEEFDDELPERHFDNFQFLDFHQKMQECGNNPLRFATHALMEMPPQIQAVKRLGYIN